MLLLLSWLASKTSFYLGFLIKQYLKYWIERSVVRISFSLRSGEKMLWMRADNCADTQANPPKERYICLSV